MSLEKPILDANSKFVLVVHGGAGTMSRANSTPEKEAAYHAGLRAALHAGYQVLKDGGEAMDTAVAAISVFEDNILFNAGKGAVFNTAGHNELEVSLMLSKPPSTHPEIPATRRGLGLALLTRIRNPSQLVRSLYLSPSKAPHVFLSGPHAEELAVQEGFELVDASYFFSLKRWKEHREGLGLPVLPLPSEVEIGGDKDELGMNPKGTVGAVALDVQGCIAAVTSTGGRTNKLPGRIGDTPHMGSGFWAEEWPVKGWIRREWNKLWGGKETQGVGISGTGDGDYFIRHTVAATMCHRVKFLGQTLDSAAQHTVEDLLKDGGTGGVIALDTDGNVAMALNCEGMYRGVIREDGVSKTAIFRDDELC
ncbi:asparaginase [Armillaria luteobubalina]|uniref:Asparaginase n=1 Tax=Armillaria luteobubalina TaxID=153913 RepID=A0AA39QL04_9AGAR|nr:asparaginase [Armillaria luteobubalina]